jgi:hypothetical protein
MAVRCASVVAQRIALLQPFFPGKKIGPSGTPCQPAAVASRSPASSSLCLLWELLGPWAPVVLDTERKEVNDRGYYAVRTPIDSHAQLPISIGGSLSLIVLD